MKLIHTAVSAIVLGASTIVVANAATFPGLIGEPVSAAEADRTIVIDSGTRWVDVTQGEVVKFVANGREFTIDFNGVAENVDLRNLAPQGALDHEVDADVAQNPLDLPN
jgi:hypothetical protein